MAAGDIELKVTIDGVDFTALVNYMVIENSLFSPLGSGAVCSIIDAEFSRKCLSIPNNPINESELENYIIGSLNSEVISIQDYKKSKPNWK